MSILELLMILSTVMILPAMAALTIAYLNGSLAESDEARHLALIDGEEDYWAGPETEATFGPDEGGGEAA
jgi:hypothetical protein